MDVWPSRNGLRRLRPIHLERSLSFPTVCLPETKWVRRPTHQPIKWSSTEYLAMFTPFGLILGSLEGKFVWFCNNIHSTNSNKLHWTERQRFGTIDWFQITPGSFLRRICLKWKWATDLGSDANSDASCVRSEADWTSDEVKEHLNNVKCSYELLYARRWNNEKSRAHTLT